MRHFALRLLAASSLLLAGALAETRPHYGGTLRVLVRAAPTSLDPADLEKAGAGGRNIARLLYDTLVTLDDRGIAKPGLSTSWQSDPSHQRWQFRLRPGVTFSDGTPVTPEVAAAALRFGNPAWRVSADTDTIIIQLDSADVGLPAELTLVRNSIVQRASGKISGTAPFTATEWQPGKKLITAARDDSWQGRPFLDSIEIDVGNTLTQDWSRYPVAEIPSEQARATRGGRSAQSSAAAELLALLFARPPATIGEGKLRDALSLSVDRKILNDVLLHGGGEPARGMLPGWMTGYDFLFSRETNLSLARQAVQEVTPGTSWSLAYDANDPTARLMAERIALNASDAGIKLALTLSGAADLRLARLSMVSLSPQIALTNLAVSMGMTPPRFASDSSEELYAAERSLLQAQRVIPLVRLKSAISLDASIHNWTSTRNGDWNLADVWLGADKP